MKELLTLLILVAARSLFGQEPTRISLEIASDHHQEHSRLRGVVDLNQDGIDDMLLSGGTTYSPYDYGVYLGKKDGGHELVGNIHTQGKRFSIDRFLRDPASDSLVCRIWTWDHFSCCDGEVVEYLLTGNELKKGARIYLGSWADNGEGEVFQAKLLNLLFNDINEDQIKWSRSIESGEAVQWIQLK